MHIQIIISIKISNMHLRECSFISDSLLEKISLLKYQYTGCPKRTTAVTDLTATFFGRANHADDRRRRSGWMPCMQSWRNWSFLVAAGRDFTTSTSFIATIRKSKSWPSRLRRFPTSPGEGIRRSWPVALSTWHRHHRGTEVEKDSPPRGHRRRRFLLQRHRPSGR